MRSTACILLAALLAGCGEARSADTECACHPSQERRTLSFEQHVAFIEPPKGDELIVAVHSDLATNILWLPAMPAEHKVIKVLNFGPQSVSVFPVAGNTINGKSGVMLGAQKGMEVQPFDSTVWHATD